MSPYGNPQGGVVLELTEGGMVMGVLPTPPTSAGISSLRKGHPRLLH